MFGGHLPELVVLLVAALVIFGPKRLPEIGSAMGKGIREFRKGTTEVAEKGAPQELPASEQPAHGEAAPRQPEPAHAPVQSPGAVQPPTPAQAPVQTHDSAATK